MIGPREHAAGLLQEDRGANTDSGSVSSESTSVKCCSVTFLLGRDQMSVYPRSDQMIAQRMATPTTSLASRWAYWGVTVKDRLIVKTWMTWRQFCPWKAHSILANDSPVIPTIPHTSSRRVNWWELVGQSLLQRHSFCSYSFGEGCWGCQTFQELPKTYRFPFFPMGQSFRFWGNKYIAIQFSMNKENSSRNYWLK